MPAKHITMPVYEVGRLRSYLWLSNNSSCSISLTQFSRNVSHFFSPQCCHCYDEDLSTAEFHDLSWLFIFLYNTKDFFIFLSNFNFLSIFLTLKWHLKGFTIMCLVKRLNDLLCQAAVDVNKCMHTNGLRLILFIRFLSESSCPTWSEIGTLQWTRKKERNESSFGSLITINPADNKSWLDSIKEKNPSTKMLSNVAQPSVESFLSDDNSQHVQNPWPAWGCTSLPSTAIAVIPLNCSSTSNTDLGQQQ